ncbi:MAG: triose-phosphate isomerase [Halolamina sp.]|uniref:triose-phosphate isomerase n=1 Tax=Halolamina sp. TaxID=1940283 RepID=UPI002FC2B55E
MFVLINLKAYDCDAVAVAETAAAVAEDTGARIAVAPQAAQLSAVAATGVETWAQHIDPVDHGSHTGSTHAAPVVDAGGTGTLLNHSEQRLTLANIDAGVEAAEQVGLKTVVCANNPDQIGAVTALGPDAVAVEPPALIGGDVSVASADPDIVTGAVDAADAVNENVDVFCGAGIASGEDVAAAADLGADGVLLASGVALAEDPEAVLRDLVSPL